MTNTEYIKGLAELSKNDWYWGLDKDYSHKYKMLFDYADCTAETRKYLESVLLFMLDASRRIFS